MASRFSREILRLAAAQAIRQQGFTTADKSALDVIADMLISYIQHIGAQSHTSAEASLRSDANLLDVLPTLQVAPPHGVSILELLAYTDGSEEFCKATPHYPISNRTRTASTAASWGRTKRKHDYVQTYLPPFPEAHEMPDTPIYPQRIEDPAAVQRLTSKLARQASQMTRELSLQDPVVRKNWNAIGSGSTAENPFLNDPSSSGNGSRGKERPDLSLLSRYRVPPSLKVTSGSGKREREGEEDEGRDTTRGRTQIQAGIGSGGGSSYTKIDAIINTRHHDGLDTTD